VTGTVNAARQGSGGRQERSPYGLVVLACGRQFTLSSPLKRKPVGPPAEHRRGRTPRAALACSRPDAVPVHASHQLPGARRSQLGSGGPRCRGLALSRLTGRRLRSASGSAYQRPLSDPPADTARGAEAEPTLAVVAGGRVGEKRSLIRGLARVEALDNEP
jgi:hypothetical protein